MDETTLMKCEGRFLLMVVGWVGLEPTTNALKGRCSTIELPTRKRAFVLVQLMHRCKLRPIADDATKFEIDRAKLSPGVST